MSGESIPLWGHKEDEAPERSVNDRHEGVDHSAVRTASLFDGQRAVDHSISASPMTGRSLVSGSDVKRERSESRSDAEGALDSRTGDQILEKREAEAPRLQTAATFGLWLGVIVSATGANADPRVPRTACTRCDPV
jgi:hypothetical protein